MQQQCKQQEVTLNLITNKGRYYLLRVIKTVASTRVLIPQLRLAPPLAPPPPR